VISWDTLSESSLRTGNVVLSFTVDENSGTLCFFAQSSPLEFNPETERILVRVRCRRVGNVKSHLFIGAIDANNMGQPLPLASYSDMQPNEGWEIIEVFHYPDSGFAIPLAQVVNYSDGNPNTNNQGEIQLDWIETEVVRRVFE